MSTLQSALKLAERGFRVFPVQPNSKEAWLPDFPNLATTDKDKIEPWFDGQDFNIGISTNDLLVIDVDPKHGGDKTVEQWKLEGKELPPTAMQKTPSGGFHYIYRAPFQVANSVSKIGKGIDTRGLGGYIVGAGSVLNGTTYLINQRPIADAPEWILEFCPRANTSPALAHVKAADVDADRARRRAEEFLKAEPAVAAGERNHAGFRVAAKLKDIGLSEVETVGMMLEYWNCEPMLDLEELSSVARSAFKYGKNPQGIDSPEAQFKAQVGVEEAVSEEDSPLVNLNKEYAFVVMGGGHAIIHETTDKKGRLRAEYLAEQTFHKKLASRMFFTSDGKSRPLTQAWMTSHIRRSYDRIVFSPGEEADEREYNLWRGFAVEALAEGEKPTAEMAEAVRMFDEHILANIAGGNQAEFKWIMAWIAHIIQKPWEKPLTALVLKGKKGTGKNAIFECIGRMFPTNYMVTADRRHMLSHFNGHLEKLLLFVLDEAFWSGDKEAEGKLKALITDPHINIEHKGKEGFKLDSRLRVAILGNETWVVPASQDERRYAVFNVGEGRRRDNAFFQRMKELMLAGGTRYLYTRLKNLDISSVDVTTPPDTEGLSEQKNQSLPVMQQWWRDCLEQAYVVSGFGNTTWMQALDRDALKQSFAQYCRQRNIRQWLPADHEFLATLRDFVPGIEITKLPNEDTWSFVLPTLVIARAAWDKYMGHKTAWRPQ